MRFLFGLITGAIVTLLVATAMNAPTGRIVSQLVDTWQQATARVRDAAAQSSQTPTPGTSVAALPRPDTTAAATVDRPVETQAAEPMTAPEPMTTLAPVSAEPAHTEPSPTPQTDGAPIADEVFTPVIPAAPMQTASSAQASVSAEKVIPPEGAISLADVLASGDIVVEQTQPLNHAPLTGQAVVWAPFHSEASARGFASRLSRQLDRPFHVKKQSAANYLVVYEYADDAERSALEQQIAYATGQDSP